MSLLLRVFALVLFVLAAVSAFASGVNVNEIGLLAAGLACWVGSSLVGEFPR